MITKDNRFKGNRAIDSVYKKGRSTKTGPFVIRVKDNPAGSGYRLAVVVSKKVDKSAVVRNRIRRRVFEQARLFSKANNKLKNDLVISVFSSDAATMKTEDLQKQLKYLLQKSTKTS